MTKDQFWELIAHSRRDFDPSRREGNMDLQALHLHDLLSLLPPEEVADFDHIFYEHCAEAYRWDLWAAGYLLLGGCSDDGFMYFRRWLISMSRDVFEAALADPEALSTLADGPGIEVCEFEEFGSIASHVMKEQGMPERPEILAPKYSNEPKGDPWQYDDLPVRFPKLWAKFGQ